MKSSLDILPEYVPLNPEDTLHFQNTQTNWVKGNAWEIKTHRGYGVCLRVTNCVLLRSICRIKKRACRNDICKILCQGKDTKLTTPHCQLIRCWIQLLETLDDTNLRTPTLSPTMLTGFCCAEFSKLQEWVGSPQTHIQNKKLTSASWIHVEVNVKEYHAVQ
jgi:hypothetical protein